MITAHPRLHVALKTTSPPSAKPSAANSAASLISWPHHLLQSQPLIPHHHQNHNRNLKLSLEFAAILLKSVGAWRVGCPFYPVPKSWVRSRSSLPTCYSSKTTRKKKKLFDKTRMMTMFLESRMLFSISFRRFPHDPSSGPIFLYHSIIMVAFIFICK